MNGAVAGPAKGAGARRTPVWKQLEQDERRTRTGKTRTVRRVASRRYAVTYDVDGPHVRLGVLWFVGLICALAAGRYLLALLLAGVAGVAGAQVATAWRPRKLRPDRRAAAAGAGALPLAAAVGGPVLGVALVAFALVALLSAVGTRGGAGGPLADAGLTVQSGMFAGLAAAGVVLTAGYSVGAAVVLVVMVSAYEVGDYLIGSGATNPYEGPAAGIVALGVVSLVVAMLSVAPFEGADVWSFAALAAVCCPLGQLAASAILPASAARASGLRRLDSLLVLGPAWAWLLGLYLAR